MGFINKFLLPHEIDFNAALLNQAETARLIINELYKACVSDDKSALEVISATAQRATELKTQNMSQLLGVFITPYDKESIYRMITQLDWITLSVKHFRLESEVYDIHSLAEYEPILKMLLEMATALEDGISKLPAKKLNPIAASITRIHDQYDQVIEACAKATARLLAQEDCKRIIRHKDMLLQLKEIAKRIYVTANTLEDMAIKVL
jgi:uncharacterized protein Yka (UPF0111/DUF47 family)